MNKKFVLTTLLLFGFLFSFCQEKKKKLSHDDYNGWKSLENFNISNDGKKVSYECNPQKGDGILFLKDPETGKKDSLPRGYEAKISPNSDFMAFKIKTQADTTRKAKIKKKKADDLPKDSLGILLFKKDTLIKFARVKSFSVPEKEMSWIAFLYEKKLEETKKDTSAASKDTTKAKKKEPKKEKPKKKKKSEGTDFVIYNPLSREMFKYESITDYNVSKNGSLIGFIKMKTDSLDSSFVFVFNTKTKTVEKIFGNKGTAKKIVANNSGNQCCFLFSQDTTDNKAYSLFFWDGKLKSCTKIADTLTTTLPKNWTASENGSIYFSDDDSKLYFGSALKPRIVPKDTIPDDEKSKVDIWTWKDHRLQSQQTVNLEKDKKKSYLAVYNIKLNKIFQVADTSIEKVMMIQKGNANIALGASTFPYDIINTWDPEYRDFYLIDLSTGEKKMIGEKKKFSCVLSSSGKYVSWFDTDTCWHIFNVATSKVVNLTKGMSEKFYNEKFDEPDYPDSYGIAGWIENDKAVLIYDRYDIWKFDPDGKIKPENISGIGRKNKMTFRYIKLDKDEQFINSKADLLLSTFVESDKSEGFYSLNISKKGSLKLLIEDKYKFNDPIKAKNSGNLLWTKGSFKVYPDLYFSDQDFKNIKRMSNINPQISKYNWGTVELVKWTSYSGEELQGLVYKPENFDASKKYPMIVYFYDRQSDNLNTHYSPKPSRSVINFPLYTSNGYIVFIPDIKYKKGHPGQDCYNAVVSGTEFMKNQSFVDKDKIGLQGQSWGGYQVGYLVTRTDIFAAAMAGAPVSNMVSAYGGVRWESGSSREGQYEKGQSRLGVSLWGNRDLFIENSPIFFADKIKTPLLIMANDNDGAVPWQQGIEYYMAMRRLQKPAWMLTYNGDEHNLMKRPNCVDLSIRMMQFFDHFLKDKPTPPWMEKGVTAIEKEYKKGY